MSISLIIRLDVRTADIMREEATADWVARVVVDVVLASLYTDIVTQGFV